MGSIDSGSGRIELDAQHSSSNTDGLNAPPRLSPVSDETRALRAEAALQEAALRPVVQPRIDAILTACRYVGDELEGLHRGYIDRTDLDPLEETRAAAIWLLSGRAIGLYRGTLVQVEAGFSSVAMVTWRACHEALQVLIAFGSPGERAEELARLWLKDEGRHGYVKQGPALEAEARYEELLSEAMQDQGMPAPSGTTAMVKDLYDKLSRVAHSRRSSCVNEYEARLRQLACGPRESSLERLRAAHWAAKCAGSVANGVGDGLRALYSQPKFFTEVIVPLHDAVTAVVESLDLTVETIVDEAGLE